MLSIVGIERCSDISGAKTGLGTLTPDSAILAAMIGDIIDIPAKTKTRVIAHGRSSGIVAPETSAADSGAKRGTLWANRWRWLTPDNELLAEVVHKPYFYSRIYFKKVTLEAFCGIDLSTGFRNLQLQPHLFYDALVRMPDTVDYEKVILGKRYFLGSRVDV